MYQLGGCFEKTVRGVVFDSLRYSLAPQMRANGRNELCRLLANGSADDRNSRSSTGDSD